MNIVSAGNMGGPQSTLHLHTVAAGEHTVTNIRVRSVKVDCWSQKMVSSQQSVSREQWQQQPAASRDCSQPSDSPHKCGKFPPFS